MRQLACILQLIALAVVGSYSDESDRLVNGKNTIIEKYPHCASIRVFGQYYCGASIIDRFYVLTAAHCVYNIFHNYILWKSTIIVTGTTYLDEGGVVHKVKNLWYHEYFEPFYLGVNDIGLIKLDRPIEFDSRQQPIKLPTSDIKANDIVTIVPWGRIGATKSVSNNLQKLNANVMLRDTCQAYYKNFIFINANDFCTFIKYGIGLCKGDSGSGAITNETIFGIVSGGKPCAVGYPDIFTNVSTYIYWIMDKMMQ